MVIAAGTTAFQRLQTILLRDNKLSSWGDVDSLNRLTALTDLRLTGNPILNDARGGGRYEVWPAASPCTLPAVVCMCMVGLLHCTTAWSHLPPTVTSCFNLDVVGMTADVSVMHRCCSEVHSALYLKLHGSIAITSVCFQQLGY